MNEREKQGIKKRRNGIRKGTIRDIEKNYLGC
jgi:hypothetical protein